MDSVQQKEENLRRVFCCLCYLFRSLCCSRCHPESRAVQLRVQSIILVCVFYSLTDHITSDMFQRGHESSLSCRAECSHTATPCITPANVMSFVSFLHILQLNTKKGAKKSPAFVCNLHTHVCTHKQSTQASSQ